MKRWFYRMLLLGFVVSLPVLPGCSCFAMSDTPPATEVRQPEPNEVEDAMKSYEQHAPKNAPRMKDYK